MLRSQKLEIKSVEIRGILSELAGTGFAGRGSAHRTQGEDGRASAGGGAASGFP